MAERIVYTLFGAFLVISAIAINNRVPIVKAEDNTRFTDSGRAVQPIKTKSTFTAKIIEITEKLPFKTVYKDNPEAEAGEETILDQGSDGKKTTITKITYYKTDTPGVGLLVPSVVEGDFPGVDQGQEYEREIIAMETIDPKDKIISRGTKIVWKTLTTPDGEIKYWKKMRVWATHYDGGAGCMGCSGRGITAIGLKAGKGIVAVDPQVIKLGSRLYIPGYGIAIAGDTGGNIKNNRIDLGFDDARTAGWYAQSVDIYLLN